MAAENWVEGGDGGTVACGGSTGNAGTMAAATATGVQGDGFSPPAPGSLPALPIEMWDHILEFLHFGGHGAAFGSVAAAPVPHAARRELDKALRGRR